ncbi:thioesterase family protein [Metarhizium album ARSEF 1941]|uniref:Thioesterase family protein n=1 Tax=Metarhizium album (strain ARSEF 1941) TaxID=1081103 RepID=A0A0B2WNJ9_METAS|nr:thioesterase family protein [Metarhizium album ARSEF 1941]KHN95224.1 thioesterase family protein [Metarhizium album ARSEF 1941]
MLVVGSDKDDIGGAMNEWLVANYKSAKAKTIPGGHISSLYHMDGICQDILGPIFPPPVQFTAGNKCSQLPPSSLARPARGRAQVQPPVSFVPRRSAFTRRTVDTCLCVACRPGLDRTYLLITPTILHNPVAFEQPLEALPSRTGLSAPGSFFIDPSGAAVLANAPVSRFFAPRPRNLWHRWSRIKRLEPPGSARSRSIPVSRSKILVAPWLLQRTRGLVPDETILTYWITGHDGRNDNDMYDHMNNSVYNFLFDSAANAYLMEYCGIHPPSSPYHPLVAHTSTNFYSSIAYPAVAEVGVRVAKLGNSSVAFELAVFEKGVEEVKAVCDFVHVFVERSTGRPAKTGMAPELRRGLEKLYNGHEQLKSNTWWAEALSSDTS